MNVCAPSSPVKRPRPVTPKRSVRARSLSPSKRQRISPKLGKSQRKLQRKQWLAEGRKRHEKEKKQKEAGPKAEKRKRRQAGWANSTKKERQVPRDAVKEEKRDAKKRKV